MNSKKRGETTMDLDKIIEGLLKRMNSRASSMTLSDGGAMPGESFQEFLTTSGGEDTPLINDINAAGNFLVRGTDNIKIPSTGLAARQLQKAVKSTAPGSVVAFTNDTAEINTTEVIYPVDLDYADFEDAIGKTPGEAGEAAANAYLDQLVGDLVMKGIAKDLQDLLLNGDDDASPGTFLATFDGLIKQVQASGNVYQPGAAQTIAEHMTGLYRDLPANARGNKKMLTYYLAPADYDEYEDMLANKGTALGDRVITQDTQGNLFFKGIAVKEVAEQPTLTTMLAHKKAIWIGANRRWTVEKVRQPRKRIVEITVSGRIGHAEALDFLTVGTRTV
jgi:hypothetical protein